ncbi:MAG: class I SAM-dependent methyltransferase [Dehalococcoidales bacterium]|nr:class I SAM-dependent methyltransferase [Dehalococcoidales bacterium]
MSRQIKRRVDFDHPSFLFRFEDKIKYLVGSRFYYEGEFRRLGIKGGENVLDFGCGGGVASLCLLKHLNKNGRVLGIDTSGYWVNIARKRLEKYPNAECRTGDVRKLHLPQESFDLIIIFQVLHEIDPGERADTLTTLSGLLKENGKIFLREPLKISHGIPLRVIRSLLSGAGLKEVSFTENGTVYRGIAVRAD